MTADTDHHQIESLLGAYVLDAVEPDEAARVERHLAACPRCRAEVDAGREVAGRLGTSARAGGAEPLPPGLWDRIAGGIATSQRRPPGPMPGLGAAPAPAAEVVAITDAPTARRRRWRGAGWAAAAVAVAAVVAVAVLGVDLAHTNNQLNHPDQSAAVRAAMATPTHRLVRLDSSEGAQLAEFVVLPDGQGYMVSSDMPTLPSDETYQLWAVIAGQPISVGLLGHQPQRASFTLASTSTPSALAVTVEPAGGVAVPDRAPVASGHVT
ncbi:MAG: anti-sigma factor domain-containing protein [Acidimicrobiales bacterium]